jgi:Na+/melibiose symporter-like transporter
MRRRLGRRLRDVGSYATALLWCSVAGAVVAGVIWWLWPSVNASHESDDGTIGGTQMEDGGHPNFLVAWIVVSLILFAFFAFGIHEQHSERRKKATARKDDGKPSISA